MVTCNYKSTKKDFLLGWFNGARENFITFKLAVFMLIIDLKVQIIEVNF